MAGVASKIGWSLTSVLCCVALGLTVGCRTPRTPNTPPNTPPPAAPTEPAAGR